MAQSQPFLDEMRRAITECVDALARHRAEYALIGGLAISYRSQPRFTQDIDFLVKVPQLVLPKLLEDLCGRGFEIDITKTINDWNQHHMTSLSYHGIQIDWLKPLIPAYLHILDLSTAEKWLDRSIQMASVEGLILMKLVAFRPQDQLDIENLVYANYESLDLDWIKAEWTLFANLDDPRMLQLLSWEKEFKKQQ